MGIEALDRTAVALATGLHLSAAPLQFYRILPDGAAANWLKEKRWTGAGFLGTLEGLALWPLLPRSPWAYGVFLVVAILAAALICGRAESSLGRHDDPRIILDEVVGLWSALAFLPATPSLVLAGFILFRVLDALKLPPYGWLEHLPGGWGIVMDDVGAGLSTNIILRALGLAGVLA